MRAGSGLSFPRPIARRPLLAREVGSADDSGLRAQFGDLYRGLRAVAAADQAAVEGLTSRAEQKILGVGYPAADDEAARIEGRGQRRESHTEPAAGILEELDRRGVAVLRGLRDQGASDGRHIPAGEVQERVGERRAGLGELTTLAHQSISARILLPAALVAAAAAQPTRHDLHMTE